ncbi:MAG: YebC/PmpR family DNA-binding transcriptional regulator [Porticoccaceae bacterium]|jgi:YebC/PmpR family DNA-binding regulatory protein|nr:YebC/PmpR family DNA-binding transcriptional regulator [Porticoccaceae bacterium]MBT3798633.1 YebC/PmpR family DNA-binding transcriptional regulator [Porticoccaceae bacterium]MBT4165112.1 YebC/PmpR family DNA-binding transcriptional regulator [Porticoccaceae bacterium]MBT4211558.1 YebC/PmpR family DNA-binding transcriptional regulator [Porticoccaceae bacterium]MBT4591469.1 YebC/PmpR family DNA-binding transcriptional regulator [Porticoccaceae bacterium]
MGRAYQNRKDSMAKTSDAKAKVYSKYGREIYVIAKAGGLDPTGNLSLRSIIERAKKDQVPSHVIEKAIEKAKGGAGENFELARYEGYGPGNCMVIIECLTDNPSRTFNDVRLCFSKTKTKIGTQGSVSHMFDHLTILMFSGQDEEAVLDALLTDDVDVVDIENEEGMLTVFAPHTESFKAKKSLSDAFGEIEYEVDEIQFIAQNTAPLSGDDVEIFETFTTMLNDLDDVQNIYHNVE